MKDSELWFVDLDKAQAALEAIEAATPRLSQDIRQRLASMTHEAARRDRRIAHIALRILLERRLGPAVRGVPFDISVSGKPTLPATLGAGATSFSLSHTRGVALIAVGSGLIGVDVERMRRVRMPEARRAPIEAEAVVLAAGAPLTGSDRDARFLNAWVRLEAVAKARGSGVGPMLERLRPGRGEAEELQPSERPTLIAHDVAMPEGLFAAVAVAIGRTPPLLFRMPETGSAVADLLIHGRGAAR